MVVTQALEEVAEEIRQNIDELGLRASGKTQKSLRVAKTKSGARLLGRAAFDTLERGSAPGLRGRWFDDVIAQWMAAKGIGGDPKRIAWSIRRYGTKTWQQGGRIDVYTPNVIKAVDEVSKKLAISVKKTIVDYLKGYKSI